MFFAKLQLSCCYVKNKIELSFREKHAILSLISVWRRRRENHSGIPFARNTLFSIRWSASPEGKRTLDEETAALMNREVAAKTEVVPQGNGNKNEVYHPALDSCKNIFYLYSSLSRSQCQWQNMTIPCLMKNSRCLNIYTIFLFLIPFLDSTATSDNLLDMWKFYVLMGHFKGVSKCRIP